MEFAVNNGENQKNKDGNDSNSNHPIRSHPNKKCQQHATIPIIESIKEEGKGESVPTSHTPQSLDTSINITLTLLQIVASISDLLTLLIQSAQRAARNILRIQRHTLTLLQASRAAL